MANLYCSVCGRHVYPTVHFKDHYVVDYYVEVTGDTEQAIITSNEQDKPDSIYLKLITPKEIITCADCMRKFKK
jgi:hypothetical protein